MAQTEGYPCQAKNNRLFADCRIFFAFSSRCLWVFQGSLVQLLSQSVDGYIDLLTPALDLFGHESLEIINLRTFGSNSKIVKLDKNYTGQHKNVHFQCKRCKAISRTISSRLERLRFIVEYNLAITRNHIF